MKVRSKALAIGMGALLVAITATTALAGHQTSGVKSYTGCLVPKDGVIIKIKEGDSPASPCTGGSMQAHFSGGDITKISVGSGLTLPNGGDNGEVRIELAAGQTLPTCTTAGRVVEWSGSAWICGVDNDTTYAAGTGLDLDINETPDEFEIEPAYRLPGKSCSTTGEFVRGFNSNGVIQCQTPTSSGIEVWQKINPAIGALGVIVLPEDEGVDLISMPLPAGTFLMTAVAEVGGRGTDELFAECHLRDVAYNPLPVHSALLDISDGAVGDVTAMVTIHGVLTLPSQGTVRFMCRSGDGDGEVAGSTLTAVKVETVHSP